MAMVRLKVNAAVLDWAAGDEVTVERTRMVDGLIRNEYVTVLQENVPDEPAPAAGSVFPDTIDVPADFVHAATGAGSAVRAELSAEVDVVPPRSGPGSGVQVWREFLARQGIDAPADATKPALIGLWDSRLATDEHQPE